MEKPKAGWHRVLLGSARSNIKTYAAVTLLYLAVALIMFYPIALNMATATPGSGGGSFQNLWDIWWVNYALFHLHTGIYYTTLLFWPVGVNLVYQTMPPLTALLSAPFQALGTVFAYNVVFMAGFALSGIAMFLLADYLTENKAAALIAGMVFTFSTFHIAQSYAHIYFINIEWVPLFLYFALRTIKEDRSYANAIGMSVSFALSALMGGIEQSVMLLILLVLAIMMYAANKPTRNRIVRKKFAVSMVLFLALAFMLGSWNFVPMLMALLHGGLSPSNYLNTVQYNAAHSHDLLALFIPSFYNGVFSFISLSPSVYSLYFSVDPTERVAYIGFTVLALALYGIYVNKKRTAMWLVLAAAFGWLTLGPYLQVGGSVTPIPGLYYLYHLMPLISVIREPARFDLIFTMMLAILAGYGAKALLDRFGANGKKKGAIMLIASALVLLIIIESNGMPLGSTAIANAVATTVAPSGLYRMLGNLTGNFSVLELPALPGRNATYVGENTYHTSITHKPLVGGYVAGENLTENLSVYIIPLAVQVRNLDLYGIAAFDSPVTQNYTDQTLLTLYHYDTAFVVVTKGAYNQTALPQLLGYMLNVFGKPVYNDNTTTAFETLSAINRSVFRSYVSYPIATQWRETMIPFNGTYTTVWVPSSPGTIVVYAPYSAAARSASAQINTTIRFSATAEAPSRLFIKKETASGPSLVAAFNVTTAMRAYSANVSLASGSGGNALFFVEGQGSSAYLRNITFSGSG